MTNNNEKSVWDKEGNHPMHVIMPIFIVIVFYMLIFITITESNNDKNKYPQSIRELYNSWSILYKENTISFEDWKNLYEAKLLK